MISEIQRLGQFLAYAEYQYGQATAQAGRAKDHYETLMLMATARFEGKMTETAKRAQVLIDYPPVATAKEAHADADAELAIMKGTREALRAGYDTVSRIVTIKQMELEMARGG